MQSTNMLKTFMTIIIGLSVMVTHISHSATPTPTKKSPSAELQTFYQQPSFLKFISLTSDIIKNQPQAENLLLVFSTMVIDKHPDYSKRIGENFRDYSAQEKQLLYKALIATNNQSTINFINKSYQYKIDAVPQYTAEEINTLKINDNPENLDRLWTAYFATGDNKYLLNILQYINSDDFILISAYEIVNRKYLCHSLTDLKKREACQKGISYTDIRENIKKRYPNDFKRMLYKVVVVASALWSLESNRHQDDLIDKQIKQMIDQNPELNYWKKIDSILKDNTKQS